MEEKGKEKIESNDSVKSQKEKIQEAKLANAIKNLIDTNKKVDDYTRQNKAGRIGQKLRYLNSFNDGLQATKGLKNKIIFINKKIEENNSRIRESVIKENEIDQSYFKDLMDTIILPEKIIIEKSIIEKEKNTEAIKIEKIKADKKNAKKIKAKEKKEAAIIAEGKKTEEKKIEEEKIKTEIISPGVVVPPKRPQKEYKRKFIWSDEKEILNLTEFFIQNEFVDEIYRASLTKFLSTGKTLTPIQWNKNIKTLTTIFFLLLQNGKLKCSNIFLAEVLHEHFYLKKSHMKKFSSVISILNNLKPEMHDKRIYRETDLGKVVFGYFVDKK